VLHPVGPHEPQVYWTRRAVLLLAIVLVIVLLAAYACSGGSAKPTAGRTTPTPTPSPTPTASSTPTACATAQLTVGTTADATTYPAGVLPHLVATIRTTGTATCTLRVSAVTWEIVSGNDTVFTTAGCPNAAKAVLTVRPNHPSRTGLIWNRHRSVTGCASPGAAAAAGTYQARAAIGGLRSAVVVFHLTG
jgi:hypothetical protein